MNTKTILAASLATVFTLSMVMMPSVFAVGSWWEIDDSSITKTGNSVDISITATGNIPQDGSAGAIGYGVITGTNDDGYPENVLALTSHKCVADSYEQRSTDTCTAGTVGILAALGLGPNEDHNDETWHAHFLDLKPNTATCNGDANNIGLEVDLARTLQTQNNVSPDNHVTVSGATISVDDLHVGDFHSAAFNKAAVVSFGISGHVDGTTVTNLCLIDPSA